MAALPDPSTADPMRLLQHSENSGASGNSQRQPTYVPTNPDIPVPATNCSTGFDEVDQLQSRMNSDLSLAAGPSDIGLRGDEELQISLRSSYPANEGDSIESEGPISSGPQCRQGYFSTQTGSVKREHRILG